MGARARIVLLWSVSLCAGACGADAGVPGPAPDEAADAAAPNAAARDTANGDPRDGTYADPGTTGEPVSDPYRRADGDAALAAIPEAMRPSDLLDAMKSKLLVPNLDSGGVALFSDVVTVDAGQDVTFCTYSRVITKGVTYLHDTLGSQTPFGHHAILQYLTTPQEPGTRACPEQSDLGAQLGQVLGGTGGEGNGAIVLPSNVVTEIPGGSQLVINHHWINTSDEAVEAQAEMITIPPDTTEDLVIARAMAILATDFEVAAGMHGETSTECSFEHDVKLLSMLGHEHQWGTHVRAERLGAAQEMIFDHDYDPDMISQPRTADFALDDPFVFAAGDKVRMACEWQNTSDMPLVFPREMCVLFGWQIGADKDTTCYNGSWL